MHTIKNLLFLLALIFSYSFADEAPTHIHFSSEEEQFIKNNPIVDVGVEKDWPPFDFFANGKYTGFAKDYLDLIEMKTGLKFNLHADTWTNLINMTKKGKIDLLPCLARNEKREKFLNFTDSYITTRDYLFAKTTNNTINKIDDIKNKTVAVVKGYVHDEILKKEHPSVKIYYVKSLLEAIDAIITNKADFIIGNIALMSYLTKEHSITQIEAKFHFGYRWNKLHMATKKEYGVLRDIIQKALDSVTIEEKNRIEKKWISQNQIVSNNTNKKELSLTNFEINYIKEKKSIKIGSSLSWAPFDYIEEGVSKGYVVDYIKLITKKLNLEPIFIADKWTNTLTKLENKEIELIPALSYNKKREEIVNFTESYISQELSIFTKKNRNDIINKDDLVGKKIGMIKAWNVTKVFKKNYPDLNVIEFESITDLLDAIRDNFIDATIQNKLMSSYYINKDYFGKIQKVSDFTLEGFKSNLHIGVRKELHTLHHILDKAIKSVTKEEIQQLEDKWLNVSKNIVFTKKEQEFIEKNTLQVGTASRWSPISFLNNKDNLDGISTDFWKIITEKAKLKVNYNIEANFSNILEKLKNKTIDVIIGTSITEDRKEYGIFSKTYLKSPIGIATLQDKNFINDASELLDKKIAVGKNFTAHKILEENYPDMNFVLVNEVKEGLELVSNNQVFAYVDIMPVLTYNIKNSGFSNIRVSGHTGYEFKLRVMIRNDYPILKSIIDKVLNRMTYEEKEKIFTKWIDTQFHSEFDYSLLWKIVLVFVIILLFVVYKNRQLIQYQKKLKLANKETENSLKNFKKLINLNIAGILIIRDRKIKYLNDETLKILGYKSKNELIDMEISNIFDVQDIDNLCSILDDIQSYEMDAIASNKEEIPVLLKGQVIEFDNMPSHIISIVNLTEIKNKEEMILQQSKMASLGEMIGNIAHQWRQPLSSISTAASGMKLQKEFGQLSDETLYDSLDKITETTQFLSQTIDDFKNYIKDNKIKKEFNISDSINKVLSIMKASFVNNFIVVEKNLSPNLNINNYENELNQVLLNILSNSKDAIREKNEDHKYIYIETYKKGNDIIIEIIDNGGGIDKDIINKVFEPYFTTKHQSQGTGLGLYMTHKILNESIGGNINIENCSFNKYDECTKVTLTIPCK